MQNISHGNLEILMVFVDRIFPMEIWRSDGVGDGGWG